MIRVEFQNRGSPHAHCILFIKNAKKLGVDSDEDVASFISRYQTCAIPENDKDLLDLVLGLQTHKHSTSCRRNGKCRFRFPHAPSFSTIIAKPASEESDIDQVSFDINQKSKVSFHLFIQNDI